MEPLYFQDIRQRLSSELKRINRREKVLEDLFNSGRIPIKPYKLMMNRITVVKGKIKDLIETLEREDEIFDRQIKTLEIILADLRFRHIDGWIDKEELERINSKIMEGIFNPNQSMKRVKNNQEIKKFKPRKRREKTSKKIRDETSKQLQQGIHCRNPWNSECRNTDIEVSIYYNGDFLPICRRCWQEISEKNLEWSTP